MSRLQDALARLPMPDSPATQPWEFSGGAFLGPYLPGPLRRAPKLLDRLGAVRLGPAGVGLDTHGTVAWSDVVEIRTCSLFELMGDGFAEDLRRRSSELVPPLPGLGKATRWAADRVAELALSMFLLALPDAPERGVPDVAAEIAYRDRRARQQRMIPGLVAGAVLTLPAVRASVLATAGACDVPVVARGRSGLLESAGARAAVLEQRRMQVARQIERLRGTDGVVDDIEEGEDHVRPIP